MKGSPRGTQQSQINEPLSNTCKFSQGTRERDAVSEKSMFEGGGGS